jgi:hypothetical protein
MAPESDTSTMTADTSSEPPNAATIRNLEAQRLRSLVEPDIALARRLHADDYELIPPGGGRISGSDYIGAIERGEFTYDVFEAASEIRVRMYDDAAILRYQARIQAHGDDWRDEGTFWHTDLYELRAGRWQAVWSQATRVRADPGT